MSRTSLLLLPLYFAAWACTGAAPATPTAVEPRGDGPEAMRVEAGGAAPEGSGDATSPEPSAASPRSVHVTGPDAEPISGAAASELERLTQGVLEAWRAKDLTALAAYATAHNQKMLAELKPGSSRYESILGEQSSRMKAVAAWDGRVRGCRYRGNRARCAFAEPTGDEVMVITFEREGDRWAFDDLHSPSRSHWEAWASSPTPRGVKPSYVDCKKVEPGMPCTPDSPPEKLVAP